MTALGILRDGNSGCTSVCVTVALLMPPTILVWAILLASARTNNNAWNCEPVLAMSEKQVLEEFRELILRRPAGMGWTTQITWAERENLKRVGIRVRADQERNTVEWVWKRDINFPQQSNGRVWHGNHCHNNPQNSWLGVTEHDGGQNGTVQTVALQSDPR
jgi:hypothetical protein